MTPAADTSRTPALRQTDWTQLALVCFASFVVWTGFGAILPYLPVFLQRAGPRAGLDDRRDRLHVLRRDVPVLVAARAPERPHRPQAGRRERHVRLRARHAAVRDHHQRLVVSALSALRGHRRGLSRTGGQRLHRRHQQRRDARPRLRPADERPVRRSRGRSGARHPAEHPRRAAAGTASTRSSWSAAP